MLATLQASELVHRQGVTSRAAAVVGPRYGGAAPGLVGIARMTAASPLVRERAEVKYFALQSRSTLNRESSGRMPFAWTVNPYRGCEFGCKYCYARYTHEFMEFWDGRDFERKIYAKMNAPEFLRRELAGAKDRGLPIALGTAADPYQPAEKHFKVTRRLLQVFAAFEGLDFSISTKSVLILRDLDLLRVISQRHRFSVHVTVTTTDERLARLLEPKAPPPAKRLEAVRALADAGIRVGVMAMPILPGLNDSPRSLQDVARDASGAGAQFLYASLLFLMPSAMKQFMPFLEREFPHLVKRYRRLYARSAYLKGEYKDQITKLITELRCRYSLPGHRCEVPVAAPHAQMTLPFAVLNSAAHQAPTFRSASEAAVCRRRECASSAGCGLLTPCNDALSPYPDPIATCP